MKPLENVSVVSVRGDAGSRGAALRSALRAAAAACSKMHNSAFLSSTGCTRSLYLSSDESPQQLLQKSSCINSTGWTPHFLPVSTLFPISPRTHTDTHWHTWQQTVWQGEQRGSIVLWNNYCYRTKNNSATHTHTRSWSCTYIKTHAPLHKCSNGSGDAEQMITELNPLFLYSAGLAAALI